MWYEYNQFLCNLFIENEMKRACPLVVISLFVIDMHQIITIIAEVMASILYIYYYYYTFHFFAMM